MQKRNTIQQHIVLRSLQERHDHPTAAMVYDEVRRQHPSISRSTVYRILGRLVEEGLIRQISLVGSDDRYDGNYRRHGHIRCRKCGAVADLRELELPLPEDAAGFLVEDWDIEYKGLCPCCQEMA